MQAAIYYFSGTGNSMYVAKELSLAFPGSETIHVSNAIKNPPKQLGEIVGIVTPVYAFGLPNMVRRFLKLLPKSEDTYFFAASNYSKFKGGAMGEIKNYLSANGNTLNYGESIKMVANYITMGKIPSTDAQQCILLKADEQLKKIKEDISEKMNNKPKSGFPVMSSKIAETTAAESAKTAAKAYIVESVCTGCARCVQICPSENITLVGKRPNFGHNCEGCLACIHWCPRHAINIGEKTKGKQRYHNPRISAEEMMFSIAKVR